ncbi:MAG: murein biosynthesis integral membrane protein MurJ [Vicinamibacterales bacterium]
MSDPEPTPVIPQSDPAAAAPASRHLARSAGVVGAATMTSRVLGLIREQVLAYWFGASDAMDAFLVAFRVPNLVRDLFAEGAMSAALVPTFSKTLATDGKARAWRLGNAVLNALAVVTGTLVILAVVFAEPIVGLLAGGFAAVPGKFELTVQLTRVVAPFLVLVALAAACMGMLNSVNVFFVPALSPAMFNAASIAAVVVLVPVARAAGYDPILAVAVGTLLGGVGQVLLQWPALRAQGFRYRPVFDFADPGLKRVLLLMGPGTVGLAATQLNVFVNTVVATGEGTGAVSYLGYAFRVMYLPIGLFGVSIATAATPAMSRLAATGDTPRMRTTLASAIALMLTLNVPATLGLVVLAEPIVRLLFERGSFTPADTVATAAAVQLYALGLVGYSVVKIVSPTFYAIGRSRTPVAVGITAVLLNATLSVTSAPVFGYRGLALSASIAALFNAATLVWLARGALGGLQLPRIAVTAAKMAIAGVLMAAAAWLTNDAAGAVFGGRGVLPQAGRLGLAILTGVAVLIAAAHLLHVREFVEVRDAVIGRVRRRPGRQA